MELLQGYVSSSSNSSSESDSGESLTDKHIRSVYLITYSQADLLKFPKREDFAGAVVQSFISAGKANVLQVVLRSRKA